MSQSVRRERFEQWLPIVSTGLLLLAVTSPAWHPRSILSDDRSELTVNNFAIPVLVIVFVGVISFIVSIRSACQGRIQGWLALLFVVTSPALLIYCALGNSLDYKNQLSVDIPSRGTYCLLQDAEFGDELLLVNVASKSVGSTKYRIVCRTDRDPDEFVSMLRPNHVFQSPAIYLTKNDLLVAIWYENKAIAAYDFRHDITYGRGPGSLNDYRRESLLELSPFLLLGPDDAPKESEFKMMRDINGPGVPNIDAIQADLKHPSPAVRRFARRLDTLLRQDQAKLEEARTE